MSKKRIVTEAQIDQVVRERIVEMLSDGEYHYITPLWSAEIDGKEYSQAVTHILHGLGAVMDIERLNYWRLVAKDDAGPKERKMPVLDPGRPDAQAREKSAAQKEPQRKGQGKMSDQTPRQIGACIPAVPNFRAEKNHIVAVFPISKDSTIGIRFESPEQLLTFCVELMEKAALVWPDHQLIEEYLND